MTSKPSYLTFQSVQAKFLALVVPLVLLSTIGVFGISEYVAWRDADHRLHDKLNELVEIQSAVLSESLWNVAHKQVGLILEAIATDPDVLGAIVRDESNNEVAAVGVTEGLKQQAFFAERDIVYRSGEDAEVIGSLSLALTNVRTKTDSTRRLFVAAGLAILLLLSVVATTIVANRRTIGAPLEKLLQAINRSRETGERVPVDWNSRDEIGKVVKAFNEMQARQKATDDKLRKAHNELESRVEKRTRELAEKSTTLERLSEQLSKYLSPQIYESIFHGTKEVKITSQRKKLTIFFSDIAGFTETADRLESEELTGLINHYLTEMTQIAIDHGATVDKYMGDGILIFFGDPETRGTDQDALQCVKMAIAMRARMRSLSDEWREVGIEKPLRVRMGIHTGFCTVGNFGSEARMDYTIIGGSVNTASRLESAATPGEILISYETFALVKDDIHCEERGSIEVKGIAYPVATYQVYDSYETLHRQHEHFREHHPHFALDMDLDAMTARDKSQAVKLLQQGMALLQDTNAKTKPMSSTRRPKAD